MVDNQLNNFCSKTHLFASPSENRLAVAVAHGSEEAG